MSQSTFVRTLRDTHRLPTVLLLASGVMLFSATSPVAEKDQKLKALIIDGRNNHDWKTTTPLLKQILETSTLFTVDVSTAPPEGQDFGDWPPKFADYDVLVSNYNDGQLWPECLRKQFVDYVRGGGGFVVVHAANNAFTGWKEYNEMIGLGWRSSEFGDRITLSDDGKVVRTPKGVGPGASHGAQHDFAIDVRDVDHPVTQSMTERWFHAKDELYHGQRGPATNMQILATAYSAEKTGGTGAHEPMIWIIPYGQGRVFTTVMGHSPYSMTCTGFITTVQRGAEWAATGKVTQNIPQDFPGSEAVTVREFNRQE